MLEALYSRWWQYFSVLFAATRPWFWLVYSNPRGQWTIIHNYDGCGWIYVLSDIMGKPRKSLSNNEQLSFSRTSKIKQSFIDPEGHA